MSNIIKRDNKIIVKDTGDKIVKISDGGIVIERKDEPAISQIPNGFVYLTIDCSRSMRGSKLAQAQKGAINFAREAQGKGYLVGLIQFTSVASHICKPYRSIPPLKRRIETMVAGDNTNMAEALYLAHDNLRDKAGNRVIVMVTDGDPNIGEPTPEKATLKAARSIKKSGIDIMTIGTDEADEKLLKKIASRTELFYMVPQERLEIGITDSVKMLPSGRRVE